MRESDEKLDQEEDTRLITGERDGVMNDYEVVIRALILFFESQGWTIDLKQWEAVMPSGYGSGPAVIDLDKLTTVILIAIGSSK